MGTYFFNDNFITCSQAYKAGRRRANSNPLNSRLYKDLSKCAVCDENNTDKSKALNKDFHKNIFEIFAVDYHEKH